MFGELLNEPSVPCASAIDIPQKGDKAQKLAKTHTLNVGG
jgi:hypothetical protein